MVICIQGGFVQGIYAARGDIPVAVIDWDVFPGDIDDEFIGLVKATHHRRTIYAYVAQPASLPLAQLEGTDIEAILETAEPTDAL